MRRGVIDRRTTETQIACDENGAPCFRTLMRDRVFFAAPFGWIGRAAVGLFIAPQLRWIFGYRTRAIAWRFGVGVPTI